MAGVAFNNMPNNILTPLAFFEVQGAQTPFSGALQCMLLGHKNLSGGTAAFNKPYRLSASNAVALFGAGSMVEAMYRKAKVNAPYVEFWGMCTSPQVGSSATIRRLTVIGPPTSDGVMTFHIGGYPIAVIVRTTDTIATIAARVRAVVNKQKYLPMTALAVTSAVELIELRCKWTAASGNNISIELGVWGDENRLVTQVLATPSDSFTAGVGNVSLSAGLASMGDQPFDVIAVGFEGVDAQLAQLDDFMNSASGRWSPLRQIFGHTVCTRYDAYSDLVTDGLLRNGAHNTTIGQLNSPTPPWEWAAAYSAIMASHWDQPPSCSRPLQGLELLGVEAPRDPLYWFTSDERNGLLDAGITTYTVDADRTVRIERVRTNYQHNAYGDPDQSLSDAITLFQAMFFVRSMKTMITGKFGRCGLTDDDVDIEGFVSPGVLADAIIHEYTFLAGVGLVENIQGFSQTLVVERNQFDANRVDCLMRPDVVNQLRVFAALTEINLQIIN